MHELVDKMAAKMAVFTAKAGSCSDEVSAAA